MVQHDSAIDGPRCQLASLKHMETLSTSPAHMLAPT